MLDEFQGRNGTSEFARRSIKNLDFVVAAGQAGAAVHPVTQLATTLLGIIVFPWERSALNAAKNIRLSAPAASGWPTWRMEGTLVESNKVEKVGHLIGLLRNSVAHGHVRFDSDSRLLDEVTVTFENRPNGSRKANWRAVIRADDLAAFCRKFSEFVADHVA